MDSTRLSSQFCFFHEMSRWFLWVSGLSTVGSTTFHSFEIAVLANIQITVVSYWRFMSAEEEDGKFNVGWFHGTVWDFINLPGNTGGGGEKKNKNSNIRRVIPTQETTCVSVSGQTHPCRPVWITLHFSKNQITRFPVSGHVWPAATLWKKKKERHLTECGAFIISAERGSRGIQQP